MTLAMVLRGHSCSLHPEDIDIPPSGKHEILIKIEACGVCRTDLHVVDGDLKPPKLPLVPGHEVVGRILEKGGSVTGLETGQRVGVPWLGSTCGQCRYCQNEQETLPLALMPAQSTHSSRWSRQESFEQH